MEGMKRVKGMGVYMSQTWPHMLRHLSLFHWLIGKDLLYVVNFCFEFFLGEFSMSDTWLLLPGSEFYLYYIYSLLPISLFHHTFNTALPLPNKSELILLAKKFHYPPLASLISAPPFVNQI